MTIFFAASMLLLLYIIIAVYVFQDIDLGTLIIVEANSLMLAIFLLLLVGKSLEVNNSHHKQAWLILQAQQDVTEDVGQLKEGVLSDLQQEHTVIGGVAAGKQANKRWTAQELIAMLGPQSKGTRRTSGRASMTLSEREALKATEKEKAEMSERRNVKYTTQNEGDSEWGAQLEERVNNAVEDEPSIVKPPQSPARIKRDQTEGGEKGKKGVPEQKGESLLDVRGGEQVEAVYCEGTVEKETVKQQKPPMKKKGSEKCLHWSTTEVGGGFLDPSSLARAVARERRKSQDVEDIAGRINQERQRRRRNRQEEEEEQDGEASPLTSNQLSPGEFVGVDDEEEEGGEGDRLFGDDDELSCPDEGQEDSSRIFPKHVLSQVKRLKRLQVRVSAETEMITLMGFKASTDMISLIGALPLFTLSSLAQFCATDGAQCFRLE
uniref:Uncharacterized protein n=1 Tax=Chromera velia CCMP2878 TaxID=1169474 RepID=A0A0G4GZ29_9ALVE|eukprot:Cvel_23992.t1-p1 / transcript=Cvel_23992.t1 / gene=Cvel_23992 / organism=Chromera_velia_CCMP2878 / gene_product=hypothetical protein / transcript_product=hypothetical protein / location=Cvel_scaffold2543:923-4841(-) / protein_length=434 / sequence_SO=supercontig / SO=protein_coding / is_pseudo=false